MVDGGHLLPQHAGSWLYVIPSEGLGLHLDPPVFQVAIRWRLGLDNLTGSQCSLCPEHVLDPHATTCKHGSGVSRQVKRCFWLSSADGPISLGKVSSLTHDNSHFHPADILLANWSLGKLVALDISVTSPLSSQIILEAGVTAGTAAYATQQKMHLAANDARTWLAMYYLSRGIIWSLV